MKKIKYLLFMLFICFVTFTTVNAAEFDCKAGAYTLTFDDTGKLVSAKGSDGKKVEKEIGTNVKPKQASECPKVDVTVSRIDGGRTLYFSFGIDCKIGTYTIRYNPSGEIVSAKNSNGENVDKYLESHFHPKSKAECPTDSTAKVAIIDGGRTLYVADINEDFISGFECEIGDYIIRYSDEGEITGAKRKGGGDIKNKYLESHFQPKSKAECPTSATAKVAIIDGGRTLYVADINETFGNSGSPTNCAGYKNQKSCEESSKGACIWDGKDTCLKKEDTNCLSFKSDISCRRSPNYSCVWVDKEKYDFLEDSFCNVDNLFYVGCGGASDIPMQVPSIISMIVNLLKIATPIILIIISMITLVKALAGSKEDEIKKATSSLTKKMIAAALVFFVVAIVQFVISKVAEDEEYNGFDDCLNCFLNNSCSESMYYKTVIAGAELCTPLYTGKPVSCDKMPKKGEVNLLNYSWLDDGEILVGNFTFDSLVDVKEIIIAYTTNSSELISETLILDKEKDSASVRIGGVLETSNPYLIVSLNNGEEQTIDLNYSRG